MMSCLRNLLLVLLAVALSASDTWAFVPTFAVSKSSRVSPLVVASSPATLEPPVTTKEKVKEKQETPDLDKARRRGEGWAVRLYNDPMNKREFVARCLMEVCGLTDSQSYQVMMQAHTAGLAVVGRYDLERAELYRNRLRENGLVCDMIPVDED